MRTLNCDNASRIIGYTHGGTASLDQSFACDGLDRLKDTIQSGTYYGYGYDATGNRSARTVGATNYANAVSPTSNRLTSVQGSSGSCRSRTSQMPVTWFAGAARLRFLGARLVPNHAATAKVCAIDRGPAASCT